MLSEVATSTVEPEDYSEAITHIFEQKDWRALDTLLQSLIDRPSDKLKDTCTKVCRSDPVPSLPSLSVLITDSGSLAFIDTGDVSPLPSTDNLTALLSSVLLEKCLVVLKTSNVSKTPIKLDALDVLRTTKSFSSKTR
jgi:hypothetical protein